MPRLRVGVDIGGTFTDIVVSDGGPAPLYAGKFPSETASGAMMNGIVTALSASGSRPEDVELVVHGTTMGSNALLERKGARVGLITTGGFRDVLEIGRGRRPTLYDLQFDRREPLVARALRYEIKERMRYDGNVVAAPSEDEVRRVAGELNAAGIRSIAVCLLHAHVNPTHEEDVARIVGEEIPDSDVFMSHSILAEAGEYERTTATVICAMLAPLFEKYLNEVSAGLVNEGIPGELFLMHSGGGMMRPDDVKLRAQTVVESGPAAGVFAAAQLAQASDPNAEAGPDFLAFDMGGTTAKASVLLGGQPAVTTEYEVGTAAHGGTSIKLSGYPIKTPVVDVIETGKGGGSIAWVDAAGVLRLGPESAGAVPGPACYGAGGSAPTVTDCNLVLGRLSAGGLAGGTMTLDAQLAEDAIASRLCETLGTDVAETAAAVLRVANAAMASSIRAISTRRGIDARELTLIGFGGAGPLHAAELARELGVRRVLIPVEPGVFSAAGLVKSDPVMDFSRACRVTCNADDAAELKSVLADLSQEARAWFAKRGAGGDAESGGSANLEFSVDVRYEGQSYSLLMGLDTGSGETNALTELRRAFDAAHKQLYSFNYPESEVEIVVCRAHARIELGSWRQGSGSSLNVQRGDSVPTSHERDVYFMDTGYVPTRVSPRTELAPGDVVAGPAVIEESTSSTVVPPDTTCVVREDGVLELRIGERDSAQAGGSGSERETAIAL